MAEIVTSSSAAATATEETIAAANKLKDEGNKLLQTFKYAQAAEKYSEAIELHPTAIFYSNRAQALIKIESYGSAIADANEALKLDPTYIKAYYRRGSANYALGKLKAALKDFKAVVKIVPKDPDAIKKMKACDKAVKEEAFAKAIESEEAEEEAVDIDAIVVEDSYTGPRLPETPAPAPAASTTAEDGAKTGAVGASEGGAAAGASASASARVKVDMQFVKDMMEHFKNQKLIHRKYVMQILVASIEHFKAQPSLLRLSLPEASSSAASVAEGEAEAPSFTVCGDTHGQFYDLCNIFAIGGLPSESKKYLFNGDFVDRGSFSVEVVLTLLAMKLALPESLYMHRGNHETKNMNKIYGFTGEVKHKYDDAVMSLFSKVFGWLPLCSVISDAVFVVHGGISTQDEGVVPLSAISSIARNREPPESGLMSDLLWADPQPQTGRSPSKRGLGFAFGPDYTQRFLDTNNLKLVIRSHEVKDEGYVEEHGGKCITVFSAPNYCDQMGNKGAFVRFTDPVTMTPQFTQFDAVPHPNIPPMRYAGNMFSL